MKKLTIRIKNLLQETYDDCISMGGDTGDAEETAKRRATEQLTQYYYTHMQMMNEMLYHAVRESSISADRYYRRTIGAYEKLTEELADVAAETGIKVDHHRAVWKPDWAAIDNIEHCTYDTKGNTQYSYLFDIVCLQDARNHYMYKVERARDNVYCQISRWEFEGLLASYAAAQIKTDNEDISRDALQDETMTALYEDRWLPWLLLLRNIMSRQVDEIRNALDMIYLDRYPYIETRCLQALDELIGDELTDLLSDLPHEKGKGENRGDLTHKTCMNDPLHLADVHWTDSVLCIDLPTDLTEELEQIASERYGIDLEDMIRCYLDWIVEDPDEFKKWILQWKE